MKLSKRQHQAQKLLNLLIKTCWGNPEFKKALLATPIETIETVTGKTCLLSAGFQVKVEDQSNPEIIYFNLPPKPNAKLF